VKSRILKGLGALLLAVSMVLVTASPAFAHDPIFMSNDQTTPDTGPFMPDGSISWALYGTVLGDGDTRGFEFDLREGDELFISLLIPNLSPEVDLSDDELPIIELAAPDGSVSIIEPEIRDVFDEPFSQTSYVNLAELREPAQAGRYRGVIVGGAPARFSVAIGESEIFFTETERSGDRPTSFAEITEPLTAWYTTPPGGVQDTSQLEDGDAEIDLDMIDEAMESGEAEAPAGSTDAPAESDESTDSGEVVESDEPDGSDETETGDEGEIADGESPDTTESASAPIVDDGSGSTWVAPVVIAAIAVLGGGAFIARRGSDD